MSRFFAAGYTSDSSSEEEALLSTSEEEMLSSSEEFSTDSEFDNNDLDESSEEDSDYDGKGPSYFLKKSFLKGHDLDLDLDTEGRKVVKSSREKLLDDMRETVDAIYNARNLDNWASVLTEFDRVGKLLVRAHQQNVPVPNFYFKMLGQLEESVGGERGKLPADQSRAFNTVRQRVKKQAKEYLQHMEAYRATPEAFDADEPVVVESDVVVGTVSGTERLMSPVFAELKQVAEARGKRNIDRTEQVAVLEALLPQASTVFEQISVYQMLLSVRFDAGTQGTFMPVELWKRNEADVNALLTLLEKNAATYQVSELGVATDDVDVEPQPNAAGVRVVLGLVAATVERLDDEFVKCLQSTDPHLTEYIERLKDEAALYRLIVRAQIYVASCSGPEHLARIVARRLDHVYYKPDQLIAAGEELAWADAWAGAGEGLALVRTAGLAPDAVVAAMADYLAAFAPYKKTAVLAQTYYLAVNNRYAAARELFLAAQVYNHIGSADLAVQVLYNRALVQLGLGAFRSGEIEEAHQILNEIANLLRLKELLGQGFSLKYPSQATTAEKQRLLPFHMHINLELLECVFMTCLLLIEIPALAAVASPKDLRRKASIKSFKNKLEFHERQYFTGPPESIKDHLIYALRCLQKGHWAQAFELLLSIKIWRLFPDHALLLQMLRLQLQNEGLRTYIFTFRTIFSKLSTANLAAQFELDESAVVAIVEKMLAQGEFQGLLDGGLINFATDEPQRSKLQELAIIMNEKVGLLNEKNEKTALNGHGRKQTLQQQQQQQKEQKEQKDSLHEENSKFRYANVNTNNDEFQATA